MDNTDVNLPRLSPIEISVSDAEKKGLLEKSGKFNPKKGIKISKDQLLSKLSAVIQPIASFSTTGLYKVDIPAGMKLMESKEKPGSYRGILLKNGSSKIEKQSNLTPYNTSVYTLMAFSSFIVGQYYMSVINNELSNIQKGIKEISETQMSKIFADIKTLFRYTKNYQTDYSYYIDDDLKRQTAIQRLYSDQQKADTNLELVIELIQNQQRNTLKLQEYIAATGKIEVLLRLQQILIATLDNITQMLSIQSNKINSTEDSNYTLLMGDLDNINRSRKSLVAWHSANMKRFGINLGTEKRSRNNAVNNLVNTAGSLLDKTIKKPKITNQILDSIKYKDLDKLFVEQVRNQLNNEPITVNELGYNQPMTLYIQNDEFYIGYS